MKKTLAFDRGAKQFRTDVDGRRFYLGANATEAEARKASIGKLRATLSTWTPDALAEAKRLAKGLGVRLEASGNEYQDQANQMALAAAGINVAATANMEDFWHAEAITLAKRVADLEALLKQYAGPRVAEGSTVTVATVLREWHAYRKQTAVYTGTTTPTDAVINEGKHVEFIIRQLPDSELRLADFDYHQIDILSKRIASRPASLKTGKPVSRQWCRESLKILRRVIRWSARTYGYRKPDEWQEATKGEVKWTKEDQLRRQKLASMIYSPDEIRTLWQFAIPSERLILLLALNCGFRQREITALRDEEIFEDRIRRFRDKSDIYAEWMLWPLTIQALGSAQRPKNRSKVTRAWLRLLDRVQKSEPLFRRLSVKRICKTGATAMRRIGGPEVSSLYLSHGNASDDALLEDYAAADWSKLNDALSKWYQELDLENTTPLTSSRTAVPLNKIERAKEMWKGGEKVEAIIDATGLSRATAYRYR